MNFDRLVNFVTKTDGSGYWAEKSATVRVKRVAITYVDDDRTFGELCAHFDTRDWDVNRDGLIYSDMMWKHTFLTCMENEFGLSPNAILDVSYSEQGMQGVDYVSMDVGTQFLIECDALYQFAVRKKAVNA